MVFVRNENQSDDELIYRVCQHKEEIGTWDDVKEILNGLLGVEYGESAYRKKYAAFDQMFNANREKFVQSESQLKQIELRIRELEREKVRFRDERNAWSKQNYTSGRVESTLALLEEKLKEIGAVQWAKHCEDLDYPSNKDMIVMLSDLHIGECFDNYFGKYDAEIAKDRMAQMLNKVRKLQAEVKAQNCYVILLGDCISGNFRKSIQITNRENVIDQIKIATELVTQFCYDLTYFFDSVNLGSVSGNHSRFAISGDYDNRAERMDDLVYWGTKLALSSNQNFHAMDSAMIDTSMGIADIRGNEYVFLHGDNDSFGKQAITNITNLIGHKPYAILFGHMHHNTFENLDDVMLVRGGSLSGSGNQYCIEKRIVGKPQQMVIVVDKDGIESFHPIELR